MKKQVPFKKDIEFKTNIDEINSISLEYEITEKKDSLIAGKFMLNGDYRMTSTSPNLDFFNYELPFSINIDKKYDISDFYYEVINNRILSINIELAVDNVVEKEDTIERCVEEEDTIEEVLDENDVSSSMSNDMEEVNEVKNFSLFDTLLDGDTYTTYKIHIITENDTLESIMMDYSITREKLEDYNDLTDLKLGNKLIIPANEN